MIFARNCAKGPKPTIPIFRFLEGEEEEEEEEEDDDDDDETAMLLMERDKGGGGLCLNERFGFARLSNKSRN